VDSGKRIKRNSSSEISGQKNLPKNGQEAAAKNGFGFEIIKNGQEVFRHRVYDATEV
jgi:hypothetical protein